MDFFIHSTRIDNSKKLSKLHKDYGLAGLGFYWTVIEVLMLSGIKMHINSLLAMREPPITFLKANDILMKYGLFAIDENKYVTLKDDKENGIGEKSLSNYFAFLRGDNSCESSDSSCASRASHAATHATTHADACCADVSGASSPASSYASSDACTYIRSSFEKSQKKYLNTQSETVYDRGGEAQSKLNVFLSKNCPHLQTMRHPLTLSEYRKLNINYTNEQIKDVLISMENEISVARDGYSVYGIANSWLKKRHG